MRRWRNAALAVVAVSVTGCGGTAALAVKPTPTVPFPTLRGMVKTVKHHVAAPQPTPKPTPVGSSITLLGITSPNGLSGSGTVTLAYDIDNETGTVQRVELGATAYSESIAANQWSDAQDDATVSVTPGRNTYQRSFAFPNAAMGQTFDILGSVDTPGFGRVYSMRRFSGVVALPPSTGGSSSPPAPSGNTSIASTLLDVQGTGTENTDFFSTASTDWQINYAFNCSGQLGGTGDFSITVYDSSNNYVDLAANVMEATGQSGTFEHQSGTFYLEVDTSCPWHVIVHG